jgi:hypothetical protein
MAPAADPGRLRPAERVSSVATPIARNNAPELSILPSEGVEGSAALRRS